MEDRCICCGEIIPEGQQVCKECMQEKKPEYIPEWKKRMKNLFLRRRRTINDKNCK